MLPASLSSSYERYKADSDFVAAWLANNAQKCGYDVITGTMPKAPRLKGKARKLAREATRAPGAASKSDCKTYRIKIKEFVPLAQAIAKHTTPRIEVPSSVAYCLQEAINKRRYHQEWHNRQDKGHGMVGYQDGHAYFLNVLEHVQEILQCKRPPGANLGASDRRSNPNNSFPANLFGNLTFEETVEISGDLEAPKPTKPSDRVRFISDLGESKQEALFASLYLFRDVHDIRAQIRDVWRRYQQRDLDLVAASVTTNTAIDFVRNLQEDFEIRFAAHPPLDGQTCLYCAYLRDTGIEKTTAEGGFEPCIMFADKILSRFTQVLTDEPSDYLPQVAPVNMVLYNVHVERQSMTMKDRFFEDFKLVMGVVPEYRVVIKATKTVQAEHEVVRGLRQLMDQKAPGFWLSFAMQIFLDLRHILRESVTMAFDELCQGAKNIMSTIKLVLDFHKPSGNTALSDPIDSSLEQVLQLVGRWTENDEVNNFRRNLSADPSVSDSFPPHYLLKRDPLWCGLLLYNFRVVAYEGAIIKVNSRLSVLASAHLYNCLKQQNLLAHPWIDMDAILSRHSPNKLFVGTLPRSLVDCAKRLALATGVSPDNFARNTRSAKVRLSKDQIRRLKIRTPVSWIFKHRYCDSSGRIGLETNHVQEILDKSAEVAKGSTELSPVARTDACQLLTRLANALHHESREMTFDYFEMHMVCWTMLRRLADELGRTMPDWVELSHDERSLPLFVFYLLTEEVEAVKRGAQSQGRLLAAAGQILDRFLASKGASLTAGATRP